MRWLVIVLAGCRAAAAPPDAGLSPADQDYLHRCMRRNAAIADGFCEERTLPNGRKAAPDDDCEKLWRDGVGDVKGYAEDCRDRLLASRLLPD